MPKLRLVSDLHLEFRTSTDPKKRVKELEDMNALDVLLPHSEYDKDSVMIFAGDNSQYWDQLEWLAHKAAPRFKHVIFVDGNHEHYRHDISDWDHEIPQIERTGPSNVTFSRVGSVQTIEVDGAVYIFHALWTNPLSISPGIVTRRNWPDFRYIHNKKFQRSFWDKDMAALHTLGREGIFRAIADVKKNMPGKKIVVVSHHLPIMEAVNPIYQFDSFTGMFASNYIRRIMDEPPDVWAFGHTHFAYDQYLGEPGVCFVNNPAGYCTPGVPLSTEKGFKPICHVEF